jgi:1-acyl-sn-glycerol-3-phosphate acyltransferase
VRRIARVSLSVTTIWRFSIEGSAPPDIRDRAYVVVANHQSMADPFLLSLLPWDMRWVSKASLFRVPIVGWVLRLGGDISLQRGDGESVRAMLAECRHALDGCLPVMLFPEGTRSRTGEVERFKDGAFELAVERGVPILPVAIAGTARCMRKGAFRLCRGKAVARILPPIDTRALAEADVPRIRDLTRDVVAAAAADLEARLGGEADG